MSKRTLLSTAFLLVAGASLWAGPYDALMSAAKKQWPKAKTAMIVCNYDASATALQELGAAAKAQGLEVTGFNVVDAKQVDAALRTVNTYMPSLVVVVDSDPVLGANGERTRTFIQKAKNWRIPVLSTGEKGVQLGAFLGSDAEGKVVASGQAAKDAGVKIQEGTRIL